MSPYTYPCKIVRVVDADTIDIELDLGFEIRMKERVRLHSLDAPEVFGAAASAAGEAARTFVKSWIGSRETNGVFVYESLRYNARDKYGRSLGILHWAKSRGLDGIEDLNAALITSGHARRV